MRHPVEGVTKMNALTLAALGYGLYLFDDGCRGGGRVSVQE